jgi:uncharacterized protein YaaQ
MQGENQAESLVLKLMMVIVDESDANKVTNFLRDRQVRFQFACTGEGTANSELLALLGFNGTTKSLCVSLLPDFHAEEMLRVMPEQIDLHKKGKGIAFTLPLSGVSHPMLHACSVENNYERALEDMDTELEKQEIVRHELVVAMVNTGCSEDLMNVAKNFGAGGGTVVNARRTGLDENGSFLGMPVQKQKEIILILIEQKNKTELMKAINLEFGLNTAARGILFSLPVDGVAGLHSGK